MSLVLYLVTAALSLWLANRFVAPFSRAAAIVLVLLPCLFTGRALVTNGVYAPVDLPFLNEPLRSMAPALGVPRPHNGVLSDLYTQMIPARAALKASLRRGEWPLWNPYILCGDLLAGSAQPAVYNPITLLACLLSLGASYTFSTSMTLLIAALGAFLFARELGCGETVALFAACGWMFAMPVTFFLLWPVSATWVWLPLILLATRRGIRAPGGRNAALLLVALTLMLVAGHPESAMHVVFVGAAYALFELAFTPARNRLPALGWSVAGGLAALLLCTVYVLPIAEAAPQTMEHQFREGMWSKVPHGKSNAEALARITTDVFPWLHGRHWIVPGVEWLPLDSAGAGSIVLAAAIYAIWRIRSRETWFFAALALFGMLMRAAWSPLFNLVQKIPLFDITINERFGYAGAFALVALAALGVEHALGRRDRAFGVTLAAVLALLAFGTVALQRAHVVDAIQPEWGTYRIATEIGCLSLAALAAVALRRRPQTLAAILLGILALQRVASEGEIYPTLPNRAAYPKVPIFRPLKDVREPFRIVGTGSMLIPGSGAAYGLEDVRGYEALTFSRYRDTYELWCVHQPIWFNRVDDINRPFISMMNVRYAIVDPKAAVPDGWYVIAEQRKARLLENSRVIPRAFVPEAVTFDDDWGRTRNAMSLTPDFRKHAWIEAPLPVHDRDNRTGSVTVSRVRGGYRVAADMQSGGGWVVITEAAWKGWRAYIDGRRVRHYNANIAFLGVYVPAGRHELRLTYLPQSFVIGRAISLATLVTILAFSVTTARRRRRAVRA